MAEIKNTFGVINDDDDAQFLENGDYQYAMNIRNSGSTGKSRGVVESVKGNAWKQFDLPGGTGECIGYFSDEENGFVYYFIRSGGKSLIIRYNYALETFETVLETAVPIFSASDAKIVEAAVIGDQLFFNDAFHEPRRLDITSGLNFTEADVWKFQRTIGDGGQVELLNEAGELPPFQVGDQIFVIREWRKAWVDAYDPFVQGQGVIVVQSISGAGAVTAVSINGIPQIAGPVPYDVNQQAQAAQDIASAINNYTPTSGPDFTAYVDPNNFEYVIIQAPLGTSTDFNGVSILVNSSPGGSAVVISGTISGIPEPQDLECNTAYYHNYDPNPQYSGVHVVEQVTSSSVILSTPISDVQDEIIFDGTTSYIGGRAYLKDANRKFNLPFDEDYIKLYRPNPPFSPYCEYDSDETKKVNNVRGSLFQFKTRFVYPNNMRSVPSPISKIPEPLYEKNVPFQYIEVWRDNNIKVWFDTGGEDVEAIELLVRESSNPNDQDWSVVKKFDKEELGINSNTSHQFSFYGDEVRIKIPVAEGEQPMDYIPHVGNAFCFIRDNRNAIGGCDEGFDNYEINGEITPVGCGLDGPAAAIIHRRWPEENQPFFLGDVTTEDLVPIQQSIYFAANKITQVDPDADYYIGSSLLPGAPAEVSNPFWKYIKNNDGQYSFTNEVPPLFDDGWEYSYVNPGVVNYEPGNISAGYRSIFFDATEPQNYPWIPMSFVFYQNPFQQNGLSVPEAPPEGYTFTVFVQYRLSKALVWADLIQSLAPTNSTVTYFENGGSSSSYAGILGFEPLGYSGQEGYYYFSQTFSRTVQANDTPETIRDYFKDAINNSDILNRDIEVELGLYQAAGLPGEVRTATFNAQVIAQDTPDNVGVPTDFPAVNPTTPTPWSDIDNVLSSLFIRPKVDLVSFEDGPGSSTTFFGMTMSTMADFYQKIGANRLRVNSSVSAPASSRGFKTGAKHLLALEYRDSVGRRWTVSPFDVKYIPYFNEPDAVGANRVTLLAKINSKAPSPATHYQFMYAGNMSMFNWLQFEVNWVSFSDSNDAMRIALSPRTVRYNNAVNAGETSDLTDIVGRSEVTYSWTRGDRMRFITAWGGDQTDDAGSNANQDATVEQFVDVEIIGEATDADNGLMVMVPKNQVLPFIDSGEIGSGSFVEIYTPKDNVSEDQTLYYEIGETFEVSPTGNHHGNRLNQGFDTPGSDNDYAEVILKGCGDAYTIGRSGIPDINRTADRTVESPWLSDFYPSSGWGPGAVNRYNPDAKRQLKKELIRYSDFLIGERNELNRYYDANVSDEPDVADGLIQRMECPDDTLYVFQELSVGLIGVNISELLSASGSEILMRTDNVLGQIRRLPGGFGIGYHRESLTYFGGSFYYASAPKGMFMQLSGTSLEAISRNKREDYWNALFNNLNRTQSEIPIITDFDPKYGELIVNVSGFAYGITTGPSGINIAGTFDGVTLAYSAAKKGWVTEYAYQPDFIGRYKNKLLSWKSGQLYIHDETDEWNNFYNGEDPVDSKITLVFNEQPQAIKFLQAIGVMYDADPVAPKEVVISTPYGPGQRTSLFEGDFEYSESQFFATVLQNELTPNVDNPIINGDDMRGQYFVVELTFGTDSKFELYAVSLEHKPSEMTIKRT